MYPCLQRLENLILRTLEQKQRYFFNNSLESRFNARTFGFHTKQISCHSKRLLFFQLFITNVFYRHGKALNCQLDGKHMRCGYWRCFSKFDFDFAIQSTAQVKAPLSYICIKNNSVYGAGSDNLCLVFINCAVWGIWFAFLSHKRLQENIRQIQMFSKCTLQLWVKMRNTY